MSFGHVSTDVLWYVCAMNQTDGPGATVGSFGLSYELLQVCRSSSDFATDSYLRVRPTCSSCLSNQNLVRVEATHVKVRLKFFFPCPALSRLHQPSRWHVFGSGCTTFFLLRRCFCCCWRSWLCQQHACMLSVPCVLYSALGYLR